MTYIESYEVPPKGRKQIREIAREIWLVFERKGYTGTHFPIVEFLDVWLPQSMPGFVFSVVEDDDEDLGTAHAMMFPNKLTICVKEHVYEGARNGQGRDRFTLAHELGHLFMHRSVGFARRLDSKAMAQIPLYRQSEWQADCFGGELLVPFHRIKPGADVFGMAADFEVSIPAARCALKQYIKEKAP